jgi:hypothetical protein
MLEFHLFRAKFIKPKQFSLFDGDLKPSDIFIKAIDEKPSIELLHNYKWHVGNVEHLTSQSGYFAVGRTTTSIIEKYDEKTRNFVVEENEESPYTHVLFNLKIGLIAIAKKTKLAPTANGIARKIEKLFQNTQIVRENEVDVKIDFLRDPESFIKHLESAYAITRFAAMFTGPNPIDADELFQKPMSVYLQQANGESGRTIIQGRDLNNEVLQSVAISVASTGNNASAQIKQSREEKGITIYLGENQVVIKVDEEDFNKQNTIKKMEEKYSLVTHS